VLGPFLFGNKWQFLTLQTSVGLRSGTTIGLSVLPGALGPVFPRCSMTDERRDWTLIIGFLSIAVAVLIIDLAF
jgi:hypothetical protein